MPRHFTACEAGDPGHWDITNGSERLFTIRGGTYSAYVYDYRQVPCAGPIKFHTVAAAMNYIFDQLMEG